MEGKKFENRVENPVDYKNTTPDQLEKDPLTEKINHAVQSIYESYLATEDDIPRIYESISSSAEVNRIELRKLPAETSICCMVEDIVPYGDMDVPKQRRYVISAGDLVKQIEKDKESIASEKYIEDIKETLKRMADGGRDMSFLNDPVETDKFFKETAFEYHGHRTTFKYSDYLTRFCIPYSSPWSIVPMWSIEKKS